MAKVRGDQSAVARREKVVEHAVGGKNPLGYQHPLVEVGVLFVRLLWGSSIQQLVDPDLMAGMASL